MKDRIRIWSGTFHVGDSNKKDSYMLKIEKKERQNERQKENLEWKFSCWR